MNSVDSHHNTGVMETLRDGAARLINRHGVHGVTPSDVCVEAGLDPTVLQEHGPSIDHVFSEISRFARMTCKSAMFETLARRRSLYESIRLASIASFETVQAHPDIHQAFLKLRAAALPEPSSVRDGDPGSLLQEQLISDTEEWIIAIGRVHNITWLLPSRSLAALFVVSMTGLTMHYFARSSPASCYEMIDFMAFDLAHRGRRQSKNLSF